MAITHAAGIITLTSGTFAGTASAGAATTLTDAGQSWTVDAYKDKIVWIHTGTGSGQKRRIMSNTAEILTVDHAWDTNPDNTSQFIVCYDMEDIYAASNAGGWGVVTKLGDRQYRIVTGAINIGDGSTKTGLGLISTQVKIANYAGVLGLARPVFYCKVGSMTQFGYVVDETLKITKHGVQLLNDNLSQSTIFVGVANTDTEMGECYIYSSQFINRGYDINGYNYYGIHIKTTDNSIQRLWNTQFSGTFVTYSRNTYKVNVVGASHSFNTCSGTMEDMYASAGTRGFSFYKTGGTVIRNPVARGNTYTLRSSSITGDITVVDADFDTWTILWEGSTNYSFMRKYSQNFTTVNAAGSALGTVQLAMYNSSGTNVFNVASDGTTGVAAEQLVAMGYYTQATGDTIQSYNNHTFKARKYGYNYVLQTRLISTKVVETLVMPTNSYVVASYATASAYTGITINGSAKTITVSGTRTIQELYDYTQYWGALSANMGYTEPLLTADGVNFTLNTDWTLTVSGSLTSTTQKMVSAVSLSGSGYFEDTTQTKWLNTGVTYYATHFKYTCKDGGTAKQYVQVAHIDASGNNRTYNTSRVAADAVESDVNGLAEGYAVWKIDATEYASQKLRVREYSYQLIETPKTLNGVPVTENVALTADAYAVGVKATVGAYTGIAVNYSTLAATVTATHTIQKLYDFIKYTHCLAANLIKDNIPLSTTNGSTFTFYTNWNLVVGASGNVTEVTKTITYTGTGALTTSAGGIFEDATKTQWEASGSVYKASHFYTNVKAITGGGNIQDAIVAYINSTGVDVTYNTSRVNGAIATDASGNAEGYVVYAIDASVDLSITQYIGEYNYQWSAIPKTVAGSPIGSSGTYETVRLVTDAQVTLTKANALLVSGITVTHATTEIDLSDGLLTAAYDNLKARQARADEIETGMKGYMCYYEFGLLISKDTNTYTLLNWNFHNFNASETGVFRNGVLHFATPGTYSLNFWDTDFMFSTAGTYDFRNATVTGTLELDQDINDAVLVQLHPDMVYNNNDVVYITVEASVAVVITVNGLTTGSRFQLYDVTNTTELMNEIADADPETYNYTYSTPTSIRLRVMYVSGATAKEWVETTGLTSANGLTFNVTPADDLVYNGNAVDGSSVTECSVSGSTIIIYVNDLDGLTTWQRIYAWYRYYLTTEAGIREQNGAYITMPTQTLIQFDTNVLQINNVDTAPLIISGANIITDSGDINDAFDYAGSNGSINNNPPIVVPFVYASATVNVWNEPPTASQIADQVWDEALSGHLTAGSTGEALDGAGGTTPPTASQIADAVWDEAISGHITSGTAGKLLKQTNTLVK